MVSEVLDGAYTMYVELDRLNFKINSSLDLLVAFGGWILVLMFVAKADHTYHAVVMNSWRWLFWQLVKLRSDVSAYVILGKTQAVDYIIDNANATDKNG